MHHHLLSESALLVLNHDLVDQRAGRPLGRGPNPGHHLHRLRAELPALHCQRLLNDRRNSHLLWDELAEWMATDWYPRAHRAGLRHHAVVFANDFFGHRTTKVVLARMDDGQLVGYHSEAAAGNCWQRRAAGRGII